MRWLPTHDGDGDGYVDSRCCNALASGMLGCGNDCDDGNSTIGDGTTVDRRLPGPAVVGISDASEIDGTG